MLHLPKLQYISDGKSFEEQYSNILLALDAGIQWIQLRWKNAEEKSIIELAEKVKHLCDKYKAILIINDHPHIAARIQATGVHLGLNDMSIADAKNILSSHQWIGGTANTLEDVQQRISENVTYIGLGPLRYTSTKEKLSPILGYEGYKKIVQTFHKDIPPIYAIGGIREQDIEPLLNIGIYGIAVSSLITSAKNKTQLIHQLNQLLYATT